MAVTIIDLFSRYAQAYWLNDGTCVSILSKLRHYISHHNRPDKIVCDAGREFSNKVFIEFCDLHKIELHFTTVNSPNSNSPIERFHSTIIEKLRIIKLTNKNDTPANHMITAVTFYNQSVHSSTGFTPFQLLYGPYDKEIEFDTTLNPIQQYNEYRIEEILPFFDEIYDKNKEKATKVLEKRNKDRDDPIDLTDCDIYVKRDRPRKTDPPYEKIHVTTQDNSKLTGTTAKGRSTTAHIKKTNSVK